MHWAADVALLQVGVNGPYKVVVDSPGTLQAIEDVSFNFFIRLGKV